MATDLQYLALSQLVYSDLPTTINGSAPTISALLSPANGVDIRDRYGNSLLELNSMSNWQLISFVSLSGDGFAAASFKNPDTGEIVFAFRGTSSFNPFTPGNDLSTDARIALAVPTVDQYDDAEDFVFQTLNRYGSVCYDTREDMFAALSNNSSGVSFTGHSLGGGLAQYMTYKTSDIQNGVTGVKSVTFNAVGIGQTLYNPVALLNQGSYNSTDHVNSNDIVGNYGIQLGTTIRHIDNSDVDYSKVDFSTISSLLYTRLQLLSGAVTTTQASSQINSLLSELATNPDVYTFEDTMRVYAGYNSAGGEGSTSPVSNLHDYHGLDTLIDENDHTNMTQTTTSQAGILQYQQIFQLMNAIHIVEVAKKEGNYNAAPSSNIMPIGHYYNTLDGVTYFSPNGRLTPGTLGQYTYTNDAIAYANYVIHRSEQALHNGSLASPYEDFQRAIASNVRRVDPLVLDLSGDGIKTTSVGNSNAYFDLDQNGFAEKTSWVDTDDGLLVLDKNNDGIINDSNELFGDQTLLSDGVTHASSGFTALAEYDENHDGIIDENDSIYSLLRVWQDLNGDGISSTNELKNLLDLGIISIGLGYLNTGITDDGNNIQVRAGEFTRVDGSTGAIGEYLFNRDTANTMDEAPITVSPDIAALPNIPGAGNVASLWKAMYNDTSGVLKTLVGDFIAEDDVSARYDILQQILLTWTGSDSIDPASRGGIFDGQKLAVMEKFFGVNFSGNPGPNSIASLVSSYNKLADNMYVALMSETRLKPVLDLLRIDALGNLSFSNVQSEIDTELLTNETTALDNLSELSRIIKFYGEAGASGFVDFRNHYATQSDVYARAIDFTGNRTQVGSTGDDSLSTSGDILALDGGDGNDYLYANTTSDIVLYGGAGDDHLYGSAGSDTLYGGTGNDVLEGGIGNDTYMFRRGDGVDTIYDSDANEGNIDSIVFANNITPEDVQAIRSGDNLELRVIGTDDKIIVERYFSAYARTSGWYSIYVGENGNKIEQFTFANGAVWSIADIKEKARVTLGTDNSETINGFNDQDDIINAYAGDDTIYAGDGNDFINGGDGNDVVFAGNGHDTLIGGSGNDQLFGENGDDLLDGGTGDDILEGGAGNDTYVFGLGYGVDKIYDSDATQGNQDTVQFLAGISPNDVIVRRSGDDLVLSISNTDDKLVVEKYFSAYARTSGWYSIYVGEDGNKIEQFTFADGTIWGIADIKERAHTIVGTDDSEFIQGYNDQKNITFGKAGDDTIYAGSLGDQMSGGVGDDALYGSIGNDTLDGGTGNDTLEGGAGNDTYIFGLGYGADKIYDSDTTEGNQDTIQFLAGVMPEDIRVRRNGDDLELNIAGTADTLVVERYFSAYGRSSGYYTNYVGENGNKIEQITFADGTIWGISDIKEKARVVQGTNDSEVVYGYNDQDDIVSAYDGDDTIYTYAGNDAIDAGAGNDIVYASDGNDTLIGGAGDDALYGEAGNDMLDGGIGNDILEGGIGNDTYRFGLGYGIDTIYDSDSTEGNQDTIQFLADITPEDIRAVRIGDDLELRVIGTDDKLIVEKYFSAYGRSSGYYANNVGPDGNKIETIKFDDGTIWSIADIKEKVRVIEGTADSDYIYGYSDQKNIISGRAGDDTIYAGVLGDQISGGDGDDTLYGSSSNDALDGGAGNDTLEGGAGNDTYVFGLGYGNDKIYDSDAAEGNVDTIQFLAGTSPEDIQVKRNGDNLELHIANTNDTLTVERYFSLYGRSSGYYTNYVGENGNKIEQIAFADGTIWDIADIRAKARFISGSDGDDYIAGYNDQKNIINTGVGDDTIYAGSLGDEIHAGAGNDTIYGSASDDLLDGGTGNDKLEGGAGNDTYIFGRGYGHDVIYDSDATPDNLDRVLFSNDISPDDAKVTRSGDDLIITINGTDDTFTVERYFSVYGRSSGYYVNNVGPDGNKIEQFVFADGTVWDIATIKDKARYINGTSGDDTISGHSGQDNIIDAGAGNDTIYVSDGKNQIFGGAGNDKLYGGSGDDTLDGGAGDDILEGGIGNDTYLFGLGYGTDTIYDNDATVGNIDTLEFLAGISPEDVFVQRVGGDLSLSILNTSDKVVIQNYFSPSTKYGYYSGIDSNAIEKITFTDGTIWDEATIKEKSRTLYGTQGDDNLYSFGDLQYILYGGDGNDSLYAAYLGDELHGDAGDDALYGSGGDDILDGGTGNDRLEGSYGNDTYLFKRGYGQDVIYDNDPTAGNVDKVILGDDINPENIQVRRINGDLELSIADTTDKLLIQNYFVSYNKSGYYVGVNSNVIEEIHFANGTVWGLEDIKEKARVVIGTDGSDNIYGFSDQQNIISGLDGDDTIYAGGLGDQISGGAGHDSLYGSVGNDTLGGGAGNDYLEGGYGNDTYVFGLGYGTDTIYDNDSTSGNTDVIEFLAGIAPSDVTAVRDNGNLELRINNTTDKLIVQNYFVPYTKYGYYSSQGANEIEEIHFSDGTIWSVADVKEMARTVTGTNANDNIYGFNDQKNIISGFDGNDTIYAGVLGDYIDGGSGNDTIYGSSGDDYIIGGAGDDILEGSTGNDTYVFNAGFGADTIYDNDNASHDSHDAVEFGVGIASEDVMVRRLSSNDLELTILGTNDKLTIQSFFSPYYRNSSWYTGTDSNAIEEFRFADGTIWAIADIKEKARYITGTDNDEVLQGFSDQRNIISGNAGNDTIYASYQGDELYGGTGNDNLYGSSGNDILDGGTGDDYLEGSTGNDTYVFGLGYGQDMIYDNDSSQGGSLDVVTFLAGINPADVSIKRTANNDLELTFAGSDDKLTVQQYFSPYYRNSSWYTGTNSNAIEEFRFADGTVWDIATIKEKARYINGADGNDTLQGFGDQQNIIVAGDGDDIIYAASLGDQMSGGAGNDMLYGASGNDTLDGSTGDDTLQGGTGDDTYIFAPGYGQDTIYDNNSGQTGDLDKVIFGAGIAPSDITAARMQNGDLELTFTGLTDKLTIQRYFSPYYKDSSWYTGTNSNAIEEFHFADNTVWDIATIRSMVTNIRGTNNADTLYGYEDNDIVHAGSGDDVLYASSGNDVLYGEVGNDYLYGDAGDDTYVFSGEFGVDHIVDYQGNDLVTIDQNQDSLIFQQSGGNLQMLVAGSSNSVTVDYWYQNNDYKVETFKASDGSTISSTQIEQLIQAMASFSTDNGGMSWSDALQQKPQDVQSIISQYWTAPTV